MRKEDNNEYLKKLRESIANGEIKPTGTRMGGKVGEGQFTCLVTDSQFGKGQNGNLRVMMTCKVLSGGTDSEVGAEFKYYIQTIKAQYLEESIALWTGILTSIYGINENKIFDDAEDLADVASNIAGIASKLASKGRLKLVVRRKAQKGLDANGKQRYYTDILSALDGDDEDDGGSTPTTVDVPPVPLAPGASVPVVSQAQIAAVAAIAPAKSSKPW